MYPFKVGSTFSLNRPYVAVKVQRVSKKKFIVCDDGVSLLRNDARLTELPEMFTIETEEGEKVQASGQFLITTETFDPYHLIVDWNGKL